MRVGLFHADPHPGNVFALPDGTLGLIDFGAVGRLDPIQQSAIIDVMVALARRDVSLLRDGVERIAEIAESTSPEQLERALARLMAEHVRPRRNVDPAVMQDLVATLSRFGMRLPTDVVLLSRALVTVDGTLRVLDPDMSLVAAATRLLDDREGHGRRRPRGAGPRRAAGDGAAPAPPARSGRSDAHADRPRRAARPQRRRRGQPADPAHARQPPPARPRRDVVPRHLGVAARRRRTTVRRWRDETGLFEVFGYGGLLIGAVLVLRVVAAVARDGTT